MAIKIENKVLQEFLTKAKMMGTQQITECIFSFKEDGLHINTNDSAKQVRVEAWLKNSAFTEYEAIGNIGLNVVDNIVSLLKRFDDIITMEVEGNLLTIKGKGKTLGVELVSEQFIETDTSSPNLTFDDVFNVSGKKMSNVIDDVKLSKDAVLTFETKPKLVEITNTGKFKFKTELVAPTSKGGCKTTFGEPFINSVSNLTEDLEISIKTDYPLKVMEKGENSVITFIIAPWIESDD